MTPSVHTHLNFRGRRFHITANDDLTSSWSDIGLLAASYPMAEGEKRRLETMMSHAAEYTVAVTLTYQDLTVLKSVDMGPNGIKPVSEDARQRAETALLHIFMRDVNPYFEFSPIPNCGKLTKEALAAQINHRGCGDELSQEEAYEARTSGLVVAYGTEDDRIVLRGALENEIHVHGSSAIQVDREGARPTWKTTEVKNEIEARAYFMREQLPCLVLSAYWNSGGYSWVMQINAPHIYFEIKNNGRRFCKGLVFEARSIE